MLITDGDITRGIGGRKRKIVASILEPKYPKLWVEYVRRVSETTGNPIKEVMESRPARRYLEKLEERSEL